ncbi:NAD(P)H-hydrate dehydratase [Aliirhizobium terrae]|uniref:NAD(P)H-hydrate dehydratase n=1 Tax=Terrirhizobium terrae TaxID=2926709 RepID=UPI002578915E|nr:NAD(P)H-hydrate dehydratase [Rhizobium sp. CC-CFT758]WJH42321.1 NAD(P)H-hydrate dehydratase [Rhizobium sp. CC-CFT758]
MFTNHRHLLLTPDEMARVDKAAASSGIPIYDLMVRAGYSVAATALARYPQAERFVVLCGPGNNGGDGYVAAFALKDAGATVAVFALGDPQHLKGAAATARDGWQGEMKAIEAYEPARGDVVIDAVFGSGLTRNVPDVIATLIGKVRDAGLSVLAVDLPSGLCGRRGVPLGAAFKADCTVTFMARKPGHLLLPGRSLCGDIEVADIGIPWRIVEAQAGGLSENGPHLWRHLLPSVGADSHKYRRGHLAVFSGEASKTGAARLSAEAGLKSGAGLVTIASPADAMEVNAGHLTTVMLKPLDRVDDLKDWLRDARLQTFVLGPGFGIGEKARDFALALGDRSLVLDADGITSFKDEPQTLFDAFSDGATRLVLTPHGGEFARLFPDLAVDETLGKVEKTQKAAERAHAAIVYKGADTVIAAPDGRATINANGPPWLATAGSGDVLAGMIGAMLAQGMPAFEAAAAGVYLHGEAAHMAGPGMTAEDLAEHAGRALGRIVGEL